MSIDPETEGRQPAEEFQAEHGLGNQPLGDLITIIEQTTGVDITVLDVHASEHGMAMRDPEFGTTIIAVAKTPPPYETAQHPLRTSSRTFCSRAPAYRSRPPTTGPPRMTWKNEPRHSPDIC